MLTAKMATEMIADRAYLGMCRMIESAAISGQNQVIIEYADTEALKRLEQNNFSIEPFLNWEGKPTKRTRISWPAP